MLLNTIEDAADNRNMLHSYIEAPEDKLFKTRLITALTRTAAHLSLKDSAKSLAQRCTALLRAFRVEYGIEDKTVSVGFDAEPALVTGILTEDVTDIFTHIGRAAAKADTPVCVFIDEIQYLDNDDIAAITAAVRRCNQLRLPVMLFCAGLPKTEKALGDAKSYSERLFTFEEVGPLDFEGAKDVITGPASEFDVSYSDDAINEILIITERYPYFLQEICSTVWVSTDSRTISLNDIKSVVSLFLERLDKVFFSVRYERCSHGERSFMTAMVKCGELPCAISNVAAIMGKTVRSISPTRAKLIGKGMIYATGHAEIDFTVPQFDAFILRQNPDLEI